MAARTLISVTSLPLMSISRICWDMRNSPGLVVSWKAASAVGSSEKNQLGERKATESASNFYFDLLHFVITITKGLWCAHIQVQADLFSCCTSKVVIPSCSLLTVVCVRSICVHSCKCFIVQSEQVWEMSPDICIVVIQHTGVMI